MLHTQLLAGLVSMLGLVWGARNICQRPGQRRRGNPGNSNSTTIQVLDLSSYQPINPAWLKAAALGEELAIHVPAPPMLKQFQASLGPNGSLNIPFGARARQDLFCLESNAVYLNHGSYGACFRLSMEVAHWYRHQLELQPVRFMESTYIAAMVSAVAEVASFVGASPQEVVPVANATSAVNAVLQSIQLSRGDVVIMFNATYPAVRSTVVRAASASGATVLQVNLGAEHLAQPQSVVGLVEEAVRQAGARGALKLAVLDHVVSFPPVIMPIKQLAAVCKKAGAHVLVDGAHAFGALPDLHVPSLGCDTYTANLHKWGCTPKGAAFLWATPEAQRGLRPLVTSHGYGLGFRGEFMWQGTLDHSSWLAVPSALALLRALGPGRVAAHNQGLVKEGAELLAQRLIAAERGSAGSPHVQQLAIIGGDGQGGNAGMLAVKLPPLIEPYAASSPGATLLHAFLREKHNIEVPVIAWDSALWVRISAQIYNVLHDYELLAQALQQLVQSQHIQ